MMFRLNMVSNSNTISVYAITKKYTPSISQNCAITEIVRIKKAREL